MARYLDFSLDQGSTLNKVLNYTDTNKANISLAGYSVRAQMRRSYYSSNSVAMIATIFDIRYQILINDLYSIMSTDLIYYQQVKGQLELIQQVLVGTKPVRFNRHMNRCYIDLSWSADVKAGEFLVFECWRILDPNTYTDVYNDMWLKRYATALIKRQWGDNLKKFAGMQLPGGVMLNGQTIYDEAVQEIQNIEQEIRNTFELPVDFFTG
ncbi:MAG: hypothetical protein EBX95_05030 [Acidimicrobiia bacterium]|nr:hypothetical protein [Acidimicrobiia bacterium]